MRKNVNVRRQFSECLRRFCLLLFMLIRCSTLQVEKAHSTPTPLVCLYFYITIDWLSWLLRPSRIPSVRKCKRQISSVCSFSSILFYLLGYIRTLHSIHCLIKTCQSSWSTWIAQKNPNVGWRNSQGVHFASCTSGPSSTRQQKLNKCQENQQNSFCLLFLLYEHKIEYFALFRISRNIP